MMYVSIIGELSISKKKIKRRKKTYWKNKLKELNNKYEQKFNISEIELIESESIIIIIIIDSSSLFIIMCMNEK